MGMILKSRKTQKHLRSKTPQLYVTLSVELAFGLPSGNAPLGELLNLETLQQLYS
tara:strand:+ start:891 stop:1055 length:165 start_codon:yes stop_codon:yes gene_type:complete